MARARHRRGRGLRVLGVVVLLVLAAVVVGAVLLDRSIDREQVDGLATNDDVEASEADDGGEGGEALPDGPTRVRHVLVVGLDDRSVLTPEERRELSTGDAEGARTETLMLVRVDPDRDQLDALRFPRDLLVTRCDGSRGRINAAYGIGERDGRGGTSCLVSTITGWSGLPIHHVVTVDFRGFVDLVDAVDGVELYLDQPLFDRRAGLDLPEGCVRLDGADALAFARARSIDSDLGRIDRQQQLVAAALEQIATPRTLADPTRLTALVRAAERNLTLDDRLSTQRMLQFGRVAAERGADDLVTRTVEGTMDASEGPWFLVPDELAAQQLFDDFADGGFTDPPPDPPSEFDGLGPADGGTTPDGETTPDGDVDAQPGPSDGPSDAAPDAAPETGPDEGLATDPAPSRPQIDGPVSPDRLQERHDREQTREEARRGPSADEDVAGDGRAVGVSVGC